MLDLTRAAWKAYGLDAKTKLVLMYLCDRVHADQNRERLEKHGIAIVKLTWKTIMFRCAIHSKATLWKALNTLRELGIIHTASQNHQGSCRFLIHLKKIEAIARKAEPLFGTEDYGDGNELSEWEDSPMGADEFDVFQIPGEASLDSKPALDGGGVAGLENKPDGLEAKPAKFNSQTTQVYPLNLQNEEISSGDRDPDGLAESDQNPYGVIFTGSGVSPSVFSGSKGPSDDDKGQGDLSSDSSFKTKVKDTRPNPGGMNPPVPPVKENIYKRPPAPLPVEVDRCPLHKYPDVFCDDCEAFDQYLTAYAKYVRENKKVTQ